MKKFFFTMVAVMVATLGFAQNTLVATLSHGDEITMYYGVYAFQNAVKAAVSGDVINLSGGSFNATDITKAIILRGTGIDDPLPTYISGELTINIPTSDENRIMMEGIRCTGGIKMAGTFSNAYFLKCLISEVYYNSSSAIMTTIFADCEMRTKFTLYGKSNVQFINCHVHDFLNYGSSSTAFFLNCVVTGDNSMRYSYASSFLNCILSGNAKLPSSAIALNCLSTYSTSCFQNSQINRNCKYAAWGDVFKSKGFYELTDEAKAAYLGDDGTEIGLHGGVMPYTSTPSYPQITTMNVANKATADGKLSVEIEVSVPE